MSHAYTEDQPVVQPATGLRSKRDWQLLSQIKNLRQTHDLLLPGQVELNAQAA